jgi:hypothetical protein
VAAAAGLYLWALLLWCARDSHTCVCWEQASLSCDTALYDVTSGITDMFHTSMFCTHVRACMLLCWRPLAQPLTMNDCARCALTSCLTLYVHPVGQLNSGLHALFPVTYVAPVIWVRVDLCAPGYRASVEVGLNQYIGAGPGS